VRAPTAILAMVSLAVACRRHPASGLVLAGWLAQEAEGCGDSLIKTADRISEGPPREAVFLFQERLPHYHFRGSVALRGDFSRLNPKNIG
jgi:hypothetical protein